MTLRVSVAVQAHPRRAAMAAALALEVGGEVILDPDPAGLPSPWRTFRRLLETTPELATHRVQIQDDAIVCDGFRTALEHAIEERPDRLLALFVGGAPYQWVRSILEARARGSAWAELEHYHWVPVVATVWPAWMIPEVLSFVDRQTWPREFIADDEIVGHFCRAQDVRVLATVPSLVQHPDLEPSIIGPRTALGQNPDRVAAHWAEPGVAARIDWTR